MNQSIYRLCSHNSSVFRLLGTAGGTEIICSEKKTFKSGKMVNLQVRLQLINDMVITTDYSNQNADKSNRICCVYRVSVEGGSVPPTRPDGKQSVCATTYFSLSAQHGLFLIYFIIILYIYRLVFVQFLFLWITCNESFKVRFEPRTSQ